ncbi:hypothetical protein AB4K20DRAFT_1789133 [Rhizopus microsporus]|uniref:C2H2-type domain-containing protein n=1 Tax=Rhizopus microsporus TaxID=58291 RepID=A0A1X0RJJ7_RHIZD|nr:hypothetical protein BCV71DRAFT_240336 [Rhizopus microsporus]
MPDDSLHENEIDSANEGIEDVPSNSNLTLGECPFCDKTYTCFNKARLHIYQQHQKEAEVRNKIVVKYAYASCIDTFDTKPKLVRHINKTHLIQLPSMPRSATGNHWELGGNNISKKFHAYRQQCLDKSKTSSFIIDGNFNELFFMSGALVLQKRYNYQSFPVDIFPPDLLRAINKAEYNTIIQKYTDDQIDEEKAKIGLLNCARIAKTKERAVINAVVALISNLYDCDAKTLSEAHLAAINKIMQTYMVK